MKWVRRILLAIAVLVCGLIAAALLTALRTERPVGFQVVRASGATGSRFLSACGIQPRGVPGRRPCWARC